MLCSQCRQGFGQVMPLSIMGQVNHADVALMILAQGLTQHAPKRAKAGAGRQQPQRSALPVGIVLQRAAAQFAQPQTVAQLQLAGKVTEFARQTAIEVKLQEWVILGQARQGIGPRHLSRPQHQMLPSPVAQASLGLQAQAQHTRAQPIDTDHLGRQPITRRIKGFDAQVPAHLALARQSPALLALRRAQGIGLRVLDLPRATHQARMATAGTATVGHGHTRLVQGIQQVAAGRYRPMALADVQFRHIRTHYKGRAQGIMPATV